jgi:hypothetical protein
MQSNFHARLKTSRIPEHIPCPMLRGHLMDRVAGQKDSSMPPVFGELACDRINNVAYNLDVAWLEPRLHKTPRSLRLEQLGHVIVGHHHKLEPVMALPRRHAHVGPRGLAVSAGLTLESM